MVILATACMNLECLMVLGYFMKVGGDEQRKGLMRVGLGGGKIWGMKHLSCLVM